MNQLSTFDPQTLQALEQSAEMYFQLIAAMKTIANDVSAVSAVAQQAQATAQQALDQVCIVDEERCQLMNIKDVKVQTAMEFYDKPGNAASYSRSFWRSVNRACGVTTYTRIKRKDFQTALEAAWNWKPI